MEKKNCSDGQVIHVIKAKCEIPVDLNKFEQHKIVYYYCIENASSEIMEENYLREKNKIRYLELEYFLMDRKDIKYSKRVNKQRRDDIVNIDVIDDVILFDNANSYLNLGQRGTLFNSHYKNLIETFLELDIFGSNSQTSFQCLKKFLNVNKCLLNEANDYHSEMSQLFKAVLIFK